MKKGILTAAVITAAVIIAAAYYVYINTKPKSQTPPVGEEKKTLGETSKIPNGLSLPLDKALIRVTKKPFGIYITPKNSPISHERFTGWHTGADFEILPGEENKDIQIFAICSGKLLAKEFGRGYGGMAVELCNINNESVTVVYGHLKLESILPKIGDKMAAGSVLGILGKGYTSETDYERKHLHLGIHKGAKIDTCGYVATEAETANWIDPVSVLK